MIISVESNATGSSWVLKQNFQRPSFFSVLYKVFLGEVTQLFPHVAENEGCREVISMYD